MFPSTWDIGLNWSTPLLLAQRTLSALPNDVMSKIHCGQLFGRRHSTLQSDSLFVLAKLLFSAQSIIVRSSPVSNFARHQANFWFCPYHFWNVCKPTRVYCHFQQEVSLSNQNTLRFLDNNLLHPRNCLVAFTGTFLSLLSSFWSQLLVRFIFMCHFCSPLQDEVELIIYMCLIFDVFSMHLHIKILSSPDVLDKLWLFLGCCQPPN